MVFEGDCAPSSTWCRPPRSAAKKASPSAISSGTEPSRIRLRRPLFSMRMTRLAPRRRPNAAFPVEGETVGKFARTKGVHGLAPTEFVTRDGKARHALDAGLVHVEPGAGRIDAALVGKADAVGDNVRATGI